MQEYRNYTTVAWRSQRVSLIVTPFCLSVCLESGCLSVIPRPAAYHDWSITTCPWTRVSLFGSPISHTFGTRGKNAKFHLFPTAAL